MATLEAVRNEDPPSRSVHRRRLWVDDTADQSYVAGVSRLTPRRLENELQHVQTLLTRPLDAAAAFPPVSEELFQTGDSTAYLHLERSLSSLRKAQALREEQSAEPARPMTVTA